jgi:hypothetical protein
LACSCGATTGKLLGYPLKEFNPEYAGPPLFVSPLAFQCAACGRRAEVIDTKEHGYNSEIGKAAGQSFDSNCRGSGEPQAAACPACGGEEFAVTAFCCHQHFDLIEDEPELEPRAQEYFDGFECRGRCVACGRESSIAGFELA